MATTEQQAIIEQMGGSKFRVMTGCKQMMVDGDKPAVTFTIGGGARKRIKYVKVELDYATDTYTMTFSKVFKLEHVIIRKIEGVYCDMLQPLFTDQTGFDTSL